ncbi:MAG: YbhB/YbcL family Raf kinase inhibitor-like protein [Bdellovibrionales bacterium]|nr:YbhB/YbcL family Raf kinase inhibitor-like protein [Bdellovibrionales bacterium]
MVAEAVTSFILSSSAFKNNESIPAKYTCEGEDFSPPLSWKGAPANTKSFALIVDDPDAPDPQHPQRTWVHWVAYNIPAEVSSLKEHTENLPPGATDGLNDWHKKGYGGPCPPIGQHRYFYKIYALDTKLQDLKNADKAALEKAMRGHILAKAELVGTYVKRKH